MRKGWIVVLAAVLAGCVDTSSATFQKQTADKCSAFGFSTGSQEMANCRMQLTIRQDQENQRRRQNAARSLSETADQMNANNQRQMDRNAYIAAHQPQYVAPLYQPRGPVTCTSHQTYGGGIQTTCN